MVVLITGGYGQVGQALHSIAPSFPAIDFRFASSEEADITNPESLREVFLKVKPDFCVNAAAYTAVDKAESESEKAYLINASGAENLARACAEFNCVLIHISTDFVFDGHQNHPYNESDQTNPQSVYGSSKLEGEKRVALATSRYFIIRTSWVYSDFGANFLKTMLRVASERPVISVVNDQIGSPTHAVDLARTIAVIIGKTTENEHANRFGTYHFSNEGETSWFGFAKKIFDIYSVQVDLRPISTAEYPTPAQRPQYSVMNKSKIKSTFGIEIPEWQISLERYKK